MKGEMDALIARKGRRAIEEGRPGRAFKTVVLAPDLR